MTHTNTNNPSHYDLLITSGVGPAEARRFVAQLAVRLERLAEQRGLGVCDVVSSGGDAGAPRSITLRLAGDAYGQLTDECGTHVLVQRSAERGRAARKRWFAAVSLHQAAPDAAATGGDDLPRDELEITACRAGGPGGQHVNKVSSAVRVHHVPTGIAVRAASERSQHANLALALRRLAGVLRERAAAQVADSRAARRHAHYTVERGRAVRAYQLDRDGRLTLTAGDPDAGASRTSV